MARKNGFIRKCILIDKDFQYHYLLTWIGMTMALLAGLVLASASMIYVLRVQRFDVLVVGNALCAVAITLLSMRYMIRHSHRIAGPAFRLERVIREVADGTYEGYVTLRQKDYLTHVADSVNYLIDRAAGRASELKEVQRLAAEFERALSEEPSTPPEILKLARWQVEKLSELSCLSASPEVTPNISSNTVDQLAEHAEVGS